MFVTPPRVQRVLECPNAPRRKIICQEFLEQTAVQRRLVFTDIDDIKIQMVKNYLTNFPSGSFRHSLELSNKVVERLNCTCERISDERCIYSRV